MNDKKGRIWSWLDLATAGIRFGPDRKAVRAELLEHMEDKTADFLRFFPGMTEEEAWDRALSEMGDAAEIGRELARIHKPWLGYLWRASQALVWTTVILLALLFPREGVGSLLQLEGPDSFYQEVGAAVERRYGDDCPGLRRTGELEPPPAVEEMGYTFTFDRLELWQADGPEADFRVVYGVLNVDLPRPWERLRYMSGNLWAEDGRGGRVQSWQEYCRQVSRGEPGEERYVECYGLSRGVLREQYEVMVEVSDPKSGEIVLRWDWPGADLAIPIPLKEGQS